MAYELTDDGLIEFALWQAQMARNAANEYRLKGEHEMAKRYYEMALGEMETVARLENLFAERKLKSSTN